MRRVPALVALNFVLSTTAAYAQAEVYSSGSSAPGIGQGGLMAPSRQEPNVQPNAPSQPISQATPSGWPVWYPQAPGYAFAGGKLYPGVTEGIFFDDNVFATHTNRRPDWAVVTRPELGWVTQGKNYTVAVDGFVEGRKYMTFDSEDQINGSAGTGFTIAPDKDTQVVGNARYIHGHLDRGASETVGPGGILLSTSFARPVAYDEGRGSAALNKRYGRWWTSLGAAGLAINYQNSTVDGTTVDFSYADGGIGVANGRVGYVIMPLTSVFFEAAGNTRDWGVSAFNSNGYRIVAGMLFEQGPGARIKGEFWGGYMNQQYEGVSFQSVSTWTYGAGLAFLVTDNLTGVIEGKREAKEAALSLATIAPEVIGANVAVCSMSPGAVCASVVESTVSGRLDYRVLPNVVIGGGVTFQEDIYLGPVAGNRIDHTISPLASVKYLPNNRVTLGFDYRYVTFNPDGGQSAGVGAVSYFRNVYLFSLNAKF